MEPRPLLIVLAAMFAGLSMLLVVAAAVTGTPLVLMAAAPLALTAGLMWYQGTGRLAGRLFGGSTHRRRRSYRAAGGPSTTRNRHGEPDDPWEDAFREEVGREARTRARRRARRRTRSRGGGGVGRERGDATATSGADGWRDRRRADEVGGLTAAEAYDVLGLDRTADEAAVREAYREKAKTLHPDTDGGSTEAFQELNDAYERLVGD